MVKISNDLIKKYVYGEDIEEYDIETLENDKDFMIQVLNFTNDGKMYSFCSDDLKLDYDFVKKVIFMFKDNKKIINEVSEYYINNSTDELKCEELKIIVKELQGNLTYLLYEDFKEIYDEYKESDIIIKYSAKALMNEIIKQNKIDFSTIIFKKISSAEDLDKIDIDSFIVDVLSKYDTELSFYLRGHLDLIEDIKTEIKNIKLDWESFRFKKEIEIYNEMFDSVNEYLHLVNSNMSWIEIIYYAASELGIANKIIIGDEFGNFIENFDIDYNYSLVKSIIKADSDEQKICENVKEIMMNSLYSLEPIDVYELADNSKKKSSSKVKSLSAKIKK